MYESILSPAAIAHAHLRDNVPLFVLTTTPRYGVVVEGLGGEHRCIEREADLPPLLLSTPVRVVCLHGLQPDRQADLAIAVLRRLLSETPRTDDRRTLLFDGVVSILAPAERVLLGGLLPPITPPTLDTYVVEHRPLPTGIAPASAVTTGDAGPCFIARLHAGGFATHITGKDPDHAQAQ